MKINSKLIIACLGALISSLGAEAQQPSVISIISNGTTAAGNVNVTQPVGNNQQPNIIIINGDNDGRNTNSNSNSNPPAAAQVPPAQVPTVVVTVQQPAETVSLLQTMVLTVQPPVQTHFAFVPVAQAPQQFLPFQPVQQQFQPFQKQPFLPVAQPAVVPQAPIAQPVVIPPQVIAPPPPPPTVTFQAPPPPIVQTPQTVFFTPTPEPAKVTTTTKTNPPEVQTVIIQLPDNRITTSTIFVPVTTIKPTPSPEAAELPFKEQIITQLFNITSNQTVTEFFQHTQTNIVDMTRDFNVTRTIDVTVTPEPASVSDASAVETVFMTVHQNYTMPAINMTFVTILPDGNVASAFASASATAYAEAFATAGTVTVTQMLTQFQTVTVTAEPASIDESPSSSSHDPVTQTVYIPVPQESINPTASSSIVSVFNHTTVISIERYIPTPVFITVHADASATANAFATAYAEAYGDNATETVTVTYTHIIERHPTPTSSHSVQTVQSIPTHVPDIYISTTVVKVPEEEGLQDDPNLDLKPEPVNIPEVPPPEECNPLIDPNCQKPLTVITCDPTKDKDCLPVDTCQNAFYNNDCSTIPIGNALMDFKCIQQLRERRPLAVNLKQAYQIPQLN